MFMGIAIIFILAGSICIMFPWMMPLGSIIYIVWMGMTVMGIMIIWVGLFVLVSRLVQTRIHLFLPFPRPNEVISIHERKGGHGFFKRGKIDALEHITMKDMIFKDTGGGTRVAGHRLIKTMETVNHNIPDWTAYFLHQLREKYRQETPEKLKSLYEQLKSLKEPIPGVMSIEQQLEAIPELKQVMMEPKLKEQLLQTKLEDLRQMAEMLYDGTIVHFEDYERFQNAAAPYDMESYTKRREIHRMMQIFHYRDLSQINWQSVVFPLAIFIILGAIAYAIFAGS